MVCNCVDYLNSYFPGILKRPDRTFSFNDFTSISENFLRPRDLNFFFIENVSLFFRNLINPITRIQAISVKWNKLLKSNCYQDCLQLSRHRKQRDCANFELELSVNNDEHLDFVKWLIRPATQNILRPFTVWRLATTFQLQSPCNLCNISLFIQ